MSDVFFITSVYFKRTQNFRYIRVGSSVQQWNRRTQWNIPIFRKCDVVRLCSMPSPDGLVHTPYPSSLRSRRLWKDVSTEQFSILWQKSKYFFRFSLIFKLNTIDNLVFLSITLFCTCIKDSRGLDNLLNYYILVVYFLRLL